jgi:hypothetical protein
MKMRNQVNDRLPGLGQIPWWSHDGFAISGKYQELFPDGPLTKISNVSLWVFILAAVFTFCAYNFLGQ